MVEYAQAEISEYWIVDPEGETVEVLALHEAVYQVVGKWGRGAAVRSEVFVGFEAAVAEVLAGEGPPRGA